jgi:hypothetical protein
VAGAGASALAAPRRHFLAGLERCDPVTGLNDGPEVLAFHRLYVVLTRAVSWLDVVHARPLLW